MYKQRIIVSKLFATFRWICLVGFSIVGLVIIWLKPLRGFANEFLPLILVFSLLALLIIKENKVARRFDGFKIKSEVYRYSHNNIEIFLNNFCHDTYKEYVYFDRLVTDLDEEFILTHKRLEGNIYDKNEKIGIYFNSNYLGEEKYFEPNSYLQKYRYRPRESGNNIKNTVFLNYICGLYGRNYEDPKDWIDIETIIIIVVDEWNESLNWVMNHSGHLPYVLICAIVRNDLDLLYIAKDNRKTKKEDYYIKREELFDILGVENRKPVGEISYGEIASRLKNKSSV